MAQYRLLTMLPALYKVWGRIRIRTNQPWIDNWKLEEMYAGIKGKCAERAWFKTAAEAEFSQTNGEK